MLRMEDFASRCVESGVVFPTELSAKYFQLLISEKLIQKKKIEDVQCALRKKHFFFCCVFVFGFWVQIRINNRRLLHDFYRLYGKPVPLVYVAPYVSHQTPFNLHGLARIDNNNNNRTVYLFFFIDRPVLLERLSPSGQRFCLCMVKILKKIPLRKKKKKRKQSTFFPGTIS
ncbi:hypothetical protein KDRO_A02270 [Kluyveromyces lactis]|nr:hypothetical protein KDRO_A02270 [Kluyveromyces lactis]